jgi:DNA-binding transcriptional LysR family regulator
MTTKISWELYLSFLSLLKEEGSLSGAARTLGMTQPTVGRHIAAQRLRKDDLIRQLCPDDSHLSRRSA